MRFTSLLILVAFAAVAANAEEHDTDTITLTTESTTGLPLDVTTPDDEDIKKRWTKNVESDAKDACERANREVKNQADDFVKYTEMIVKEMKDLEKEAKDVHKTAQNATKDAKKAFEQAKKAYDETGGDELQAEMDTASAAYEAAVDNETFT